MNLAKLLTRALVHLAGDLDPAQPIRILGDATIERFGDALAVLAGGKAMLVGRIADKRNLRQDRWHVCADQHNERSLLYAAVANCEALDGETAMQRCLDISGKFTRLFD